MKCVEEINKYSDIKVILKKEEKENKKVVSMTFEIKRSNYRYPVDDLLDYENYNKKTKKEIQDILNSIIIAKYKVKFENNTTDLFCKEALISLIIELKNNEYEEIEIKYPILYFLGVLKNKHKDMTGEEITDTQIRRHQIENMIL